MEDDFQVTTGKKEFAAFKRYVKKWAKLFHLESWLIYTEHTDDEDKGFEEGHISWVRFTYESQVAKIYLSKTWGIPYTAKICEMCAFHECFHLRNAQLMELFDEGPEEIQNIADKYEHLLIGSFEEIMFSKDHKSSAKGFN